MYTNLEDHGGDFVDVLDHEFLHAKNITIASGYTSLDIIKRYDKYFTEVASTGGTSKLLLGMAFYEGLNQKKLNAITSLNEKLTALSDQSGVSVCNGRRFHGKVYKFDDGLDTRFYVGSSNFSQSGVMGNIECTISLETKRQKEKVDLFLDELYSPNYSVRLDQANIPMIGKSSTATTNKALCLWNKLETYNTKDIEIRECPDFRISLSELSAKGKSNLNVYFGKGRLSRSSGMVSPRPWYEIEIIPRRDIRKDRSYPKGDFLAYTDDGLIIPMRTQGDDFKNLRSRNSLQLFGKWFKGKLEKRECLKRYTPITSETFDQYGNDELNFHKIAEGKYYISF